MIMAARIGPHDSESSGSDSSDAEETRRLKEAAVTTEYTTKITHSSAETNNRNVPDVKDVNGSTVPTLPSKRPRDRNDNDEENVFEVTPECRAFIAKKLSEMLDRQLEECVTGKLAGGTKSASRDKDEGIRLFLDSSKRLTETDTLEAPPVAACQRRRRKVSSSSSDSSEEERLASVAVTEEFLARERETLVRLSHTASADSEKDTVLFASPATDVGNRVADLETTDKPKEKKKRKKKEKHSVLGSDSDGESSARKHKTEESVTSQDDVSVEGDVLGSDNVKKKKKKEKISAPTCDSNGQKSGQKHKHSDQSSPQDNRHADVDVTGDGSAGNSVRKKKCKKRKRENGDEQSSVIENVTVSEKDSECGTAGSRGFWPQDAWPGSVMKDKKSDKSKTKLWWQKGGKPGRGPEFEKQRKSSSW